MEEGDPNALNSLANLYNFGTLVKQDLPKAVEYYKEAAKKGNILAMNNLGNLFLNGKGSLKSDFNQAIKYYKMARNNGVALNNLGNIYFYGKGVPVDKNKAIEYYKLAAEKGNDLAMNNLGQGNYKIKKKIYCLI